VTPQVRVVRGDPDDVELVALMAGLVAGTSAGTATTALADLNEDATAARHRWQTAVRRAQDPVRRDVGWRWSLRGCTGPGASVR
jgi:hypothetical protein